MSRVKLWYSQEHRDKHLAAWRACMAPTTLAAGEKACVERLSEEAYKDGAQDATAAINDLRRFHDNTELGIVVGSITIMTTAAMWFIGGKK